MVEETINEIEIAEQKYKKAEAEREKNISRNERALRELCDQPKWNNIHIIGVSEEEERETDGKFFWGGNCWKLPQSGEGDSLSGHGGAQISQHKGPKEDNTKK